MSRYTIPPAHQLQAPGAVESILGINPTRTAIIQFLSQTGEGVTTGHIAREIDIKYHTVLRHVESLHEIGVVSCDTPHEQRQGKRVLYRLDVNRLNEHLQAMTRYLLGEDAK